MRVPRTVFLLGAGAVVDAGLPTSIQLAEKVHEYLRDMSTQEGGEYHKLQLDLYRFLDGGIRFQRGLRGLDPTQSVNVEEIATAALRLRSRIENPIAPYVSGWNNRLLELEGMSDELLDDFATTVYAKLSDFLQTPDPDSIAYLARIAEFTGDGPVDVFSLNYDMCFERSFDGVQKTFTNGFDEDGWKPTLLEAESDLRFLKLHGSLDWVDDEEFGICSLEFPRGRRASELEGARPLLIFGTDSKLTGKEPFLSLLYHFSKSLDACDVLITVGYSFSDPHINEVIAQRFNSNIKMQTIVVGYGTQAHELTRGIQTLHRSPRVEVYDGGAKKSLDNNVLLRKTKVVFKSMQSNDPF